MRARAQGPSEVRLFPVSVAVAVPVLVAVTVSVPVRLFPDLSPSLTPVADCRAACARNPNAIAVEFFNVD